VLLAEQWRLFRPHHTGTDAAENQDAKLEQLGQH
jgi:hypothetical protein